MKKEVIVTDRLVFRELCMNDLNQFYMLENNPQVRKYIPNLRKTTINECKETLKKHIYKYSYGNGLNTWALESRETDSFIGITGYRYLDEINNVEIGIRLLPDSWGNGYATETGKALIRYGFSVLGLDKIIAMALPENEKSVKSLENIGLDFEKHGYFRGSKVIFYKKERYDKDIYKFFI